jgi:hypothetical protein
MSMTPADLTSKGRIPDDLSTYKFIRQPIATVELDCRVPRKREAGPNETPHRVPFWLGRPETPSRHGCGMRVGGVNQGKYLKLGAPTRPPGRSTSVGAARCRYFI